jgi:hypothetical protein
VSIIYRSTATGHKDCVSSVFAPPLNISIPLDPKAPWGWSKIEEQNKKIEKFISEKFPKILYLDIFPSTILRKV